MMETFIVLGLCFILYEALDFFQGCINSATPPTSDQIDAYRRQLDEQRQQQQQEQFLANLSPLLTAQLAALTGSTLSADTDSLTSASTASVISELRAAVFGGSGGITDSGGGGGGSESETAAYSLSTPALSGTVGVSGAYGFRPANRSVYESQELHSTSSLPRDYYYLQQQQLKNKNSSKPLLSKFANSSDNRIYPESPSILGVPPAVVTTQPLSSNSSNSTFDCQPPVLLPTAPLGLDLKRAILSNNNNNCHNNNNNNNNEYKKLPKNSRNCNKDQLVHAHNETTTGPGEYVKINTVCLAAEKRAQSILPGRAVATFKKNDSEFDNDHDNEDCESVSGVSVASSSSSASSSATSDSVSEASASLEAVSDDQADEEEPDVNVGSCTSIHGDLREIACERLRRKCVGVKRIYSISEKF